MKSIVGIFGLVVLLSACSSNDEGRIIAVKHHDMNKETASVKVIPTSKMSVEVSGMSCVHACGGAIRMELKDTKAVDRVSFDFEDGRKTNTCFITFDEKKISEKEIISIIKKINNKQFTTGKSSVEPIKA